VVDRFSIDCRRALLAAEREARSLKHGHIGTEHVLLGMFKVEVSVAAQALRMMGVTYRKARRRILALVAIGSEPALGRVSFSLRVRRVLDAFTGVVWSQRLGESLIGPSFQSAATTAGAFEAQPAARLGRHRAEVRTNDLLLALIAHGDGIAPLVLAELGGDVEKAAVATTHVRFPVTPAPPWSTAAAVWPPSPPSMD
jgi:ATP-dependent Clp protease ATP-binding subunit ClpA